MDFEKLKEVRNMGFIKDMGVEIYDVKPGYAKGKLEIKEKHGNPIGSVHGGVLFSLCDNIGGTAATSRGRYVTTLSGNINYLRPAMNCKMLYGESTEIKTGKNVCVYDVTITNELDDVLCIARMTYYYLKEIAAEDFLKDMK